MLLKRLIVVSLCPAPLQVAAIDHLAMHFSMDSNLLHKESDEAHRQQAQGEGGAHTHTHTHTHT